MSDIFASPFFCITISILAFFIGLEIQKRTKIALCIPLLLAIILVIVFLKIFGIPYDDYNEGGAIINMFLAPATACLAVSIYTKRRILKESWLPILVGCTVGCLASMGSVLVMCHLFGLDEAMTASVTTAIAISVAESHGGIAPVTVVAVLLTGILGSIIAPFMIRLLRIKNPVEVGIAIGACSHAVGTSKAIEIGETEGAMSGLAIGVCGIITVVFSMFL